MSRRRSPDRRRAGACACAIRWLCAATLVSILLAAPAGAAPLGEIDAGDNNRFVLVGERILMWQEAGELLSVTEPDGTRRVLYRARGFKGQDSLIDQVARPTRSSPSSPRATTPSARAAVSGPACDRGRSQGRTA